VEVDIRITLELSDSLAELFERFIFALENYEEEDGEGKTTES